MSVAIKSNVSVFVKVSPMYINDTLQYYIIEVLDTIIFMDIFDN